MHYHVWTIGCQMNKADSERVAAALKELGLEPTLRPEAAQVLVVNTCVVRGSAEDRVAGKLAALQGLKRRSPEVILAVMGCLVPPDRVSMAARFPHVDLFFTVHEIARLVELFHQRAARLESVVAGAPPTAGAVSTASTSADLGLRELTESVPDTVSPSRYVPIIYGCDNHCAYCIVPYRRGPERSRPPFDVVREVEQLVIRGAKEVTLLGQNVDAYRWVQASGPDADGRPAARRQAGPQLPARGHRYTANQLRSPTCLICCAKYTPFLACSGCASSPRILVT